MQVCTWRPSFLWAMSGFLGFLVSSSPSSLERLRAGKSFQQLNEQDFSLVFKGRKVFLVGTLHLAPITYLPQSETGLGSEHVIQVIKEQDKLHLGILQALNVKTEELLQWLPSPPWSSVLPLCTALQLPWLPHNCGD